ncbi:hypothetical protein AALO_G00290900 [Alosa alosa]|uniref:Arb2 domain-containing protein n=1 Tax=Alosa alosa TaxID=278164 RepID=A0AAV6FGR4_9TELE|nr:cotranscriptional regulator FAM172A homolog [Alosa sapidissima]XP_041937146.1 cotranscriptional regulator FAM172A homolog [Alosa sapidissima]XP_048091003.1 cotranscriptional regulator FAM172A homolog [Alosa alosa]XP_048091004.1 cotranscriptional regulator FAM172A homolog [Alosa alosa]KAG5261994.1 hypothetical protein AALO_G00290900 [Alosa alosa]
MEFGSNIDHNNQSLSGFPYCFTKDGLLCHKVTGELYVFRFNCHDVQSTQREQATLCSFITTYVYNILEHHLQLQRAFLPHNEGFVYMSPGALQNKRALLVLVQDTGTIRCGVWSWRMVVREGLRRGGQILYVLWAISESWGVLLMNPNEGGLSSEEHVCRVWDCLISQSAAEHIVMVAHGYGGLAFVDLLCRRAEAVESRVSAVAFIDSSHNVWHQPLRADGRGWLRAHSRRWVLSSKPLNGPVGTLRAGMQLSAGTLCHDSAPATCMESVFRFFTKAIRPRAPPTPFSIVTRSRSMCLAQERDIRAGNHPSK